VRAYLPFFLPSIPPLGTLGAFISMRDPIPNRRALLDIGVAGPLVGFVIAIPVTLAGLALTAATPGNALAESPQPSILFLVLSQFFPVSGAVAQHPLAFAGWFGLFVTSINLLPAGQLDGGHVLYAALGRRPRFLPALLVAFLIWLGWHGWMGWLAWAGIIIALLSLGHPPTANDPLPLGLGRRLATIATFVVFVLTFVGEPFRITP